MSLPASSIAKGSWILVTGATGRLASHIVKQCLDRGFKVRGTIRDHTQGALLADLLQPHTQEGDLELVVADLSLPNSFDEAIKGVSAVIHVATITTFEGDPNKVIPQAVLGTKSILNAAHRESSVREFVYTSSIVAATMPVPGNDTHVGHHTWNDAALQMAWAPPYDAEKSIMVYMASKVEAEKEVWRFAAEESPNFTINVINPGSLIGQPLLPKHAKAPIAWAYIAWAGITEEMERMPAFYAIGLKDAALLHIAVILDPDIKNTRLQTWGHSCNWNDMLAILRKISPDRKFVSDLPNPQRMSLTTDDNLSLRLLRKWGHQDGWVALEQIIEESLVFWK